MNAAIGIVVLPLLMVAIVFYFLPLLARPGIYFGATVDPAFPRSPEGRRLLDSFRLQVIVSGLLACGLAVLLLPLNLVGAELVPMALLIAAVSFVYWKKFHQVHSHYGERLPEVRQADLSAQPAKESFSPWLVLPPFLALAAVGVFLQLHWDQLPQHYPIHFDINGEPNRWADRTALSVFSPLLVGGATNLLLLGLAWLIATTSRKTVMRYVTVRGLQVMLYPLTFTLVTVSLLPFWRSPMWIVPLVMLVSIAGLIYWSYGRISSPHSSDAVPEPRSDNYWKAGMFYYNPDDPAIFVAKRVGIGYTINFASKWAWVVLIGLLLTPLVPLLLVRMK